jgi:glycosyltransferase involved in cell wall biosynthesis
LSLKPPASSSSGSSSTASEATPIGLEITVVMPCLNEALTIAICVKRALETLQAHGIRGEVIVADNGSTDGSQKIASDLGARVVDVPMKGYGAALLGGIAAARGTYVLMGDSDASYDFGEIPRFLERLRAGDDVVMGNRFKGEIKPGAMPFLHRYLGNPVLTKMGRIFFDVPSGDFHCGIRAFKKSSIDALNLRTTGMEFASEMVIKATLAKLKISEVPTTLSKDGRDRPPHLRTWRDGWRHLRFMLLYSPRWLFLYPGLALFLIGAALMTLLVPGAQTIGSVTLDIHTLVYGAALVLVGFQAIIFAVFSRIYAVTAGFLPHSESMQRWFDRIQLETGVVVGVILALCGTAGSAIAFSGWMGSGFSGQDPAVLMRIVVPSVTLLAIGAQTIFSSFFLSLLGMAKKG